jgi:hypothetical protein
MKLTQYFLTLNQRADRADIKLEWIQQAIDHPVQEMIQQDGRVRRWVKIEATDEKYNGKYLRVILLEDRETIHNAFFDRGFKP